MSKLKSFIESHEVRIGKDFTINRPVYYASLQEAFFHYFESFRDNPYAAIFLIPERDRKSLAFETGSNENIMMSLLSFHRFFELLLKDILNSINPMLRVKFPQREEDIFKYIENKIDADNLQTVEFAEALKRFRATFKYYNYNSPEYSGHLVNYAFLMEVNSLEMLEILNTWRNRIMHNGDTIPNILAFDFFITQYIIPIADKVVKFHQSRQPETFTPHYYSTKTEVRIIEEFLKIKLSLSEYSDVNTKEELRLKLAKIGHLKEMGRTTYYEPVAQFFEPAYDNIATRYENFAESERKHPEFYNLTNCHCCGKKTLLIYKKEYHDIFESSQANNKWCKCIYCDFTMNERFGDPNLFGFSKSKIFG